MAEPLSVNLQDPSVRAMLGADGMIRNPETNRGMVQIAGDAPDPTRRSDARGISATTRLDSGKREVIVVFKASSVVMTIDVYAVPGEPLEVHLICPRCRKSSRVTQAMKAMEWDPTTRPMVIPNGQTLVSEGTISIEPFECSHELPDALYEQHAGTTRHGMSLCRQQLVIDRNIAREA